MLPLLAGAQALGILLAALLDGDGRAGWWLAGLLLAAALVACRRPPLFLPALLGGTLVAGWSAGSAALRPSLPPCHVAHHTGNQEVRLLATVASDAVPLPEGSFRQQLSAEALLGSRRAAAAATGALEAPVQLCGSVELKWSQAMPDLMPGEKVLLRGRLRPAQGSRNPGAPSAQLRRLAASVGAVIYADPARLVRLGPASRPPLLSALRARIRRALQQSIPAASSREVVAALVLGDGALKPELRQAYARAGTSHLLAVSGLHLSLVALGALALLRRGLLFVPALAGQDPARVAALPAAGLALCYTCLAGAPASACRACLMACAGFLSLLLQRPADLARPLALAALGLLAWDPLNLFRISFQLSFLAVIGIGVVFAREEEAVPAAGLFVRLWHGVKRLLLASLAAGLLTAPVAAHHFHQVSLVGVLANLAAVPLTGYGLLPASLLGSALGAVHPSLGAPLLWLAGRLAAGLNWLSLTLAALPGAALPIALGWTAALGCLGLGLALLLGPTPDRRPARRLALLLGLVLLGGACLHAHCRGRGDLELAFLDVGQGDSTFVRLPDGFSLLVDGGGGLMGGDPGRSQVLPFLRGAGVRRLDLAVLSHPHPDHAVGLASVLRELPVGELWVCWHREQDPWLAGVLAAARERGVPVRRPRRLERAGARLVPLWPRGFEGECADPGFSTNDNSLVLRLEHGRSSVLLAADIEADAEAELLRAWPPRELRADLLKVPHHGSAGSSSLDFLRAVSPRLAVISCAASNHYGFPAPAALERYQALRIPLARTDERGAIGVKLSAAGELRWSPLSSPVP